ncbi:unnamed protein product [Dicrocoelium dendriticum]|nr:unnamed protein product [Dicrocoelium dendriticum]
MFIAIWLFITAISVAAPERMQKRMIGGRNLTNLEYPWIVRITEVEPEPITHEPKTCTGVLLSEDFVLTVASCFGKNRWELFQSTVSSWYIEIRNALGEFMVARDIRLQVDTVIRPRVIKAGKPIINEIYEKGDQRYEGNVAILKLEIEDHSNALPSEYGKIMFRRNDSELMPLENDTGVYVGWHRKVPIYGVVIPQSTNLRVLSEDDCIWAMGPEYNKKSQFCANTTPSSTVMFDTEATGGVFILQKSNDEFVAGLLIGRAENDGPLIFTRVSYYYQWILETTVEIIN